MRLPPSTPDQCPACGSDRVLRIVYGLAPPDAADDPTLQLGGCMVFDEDPTWSCGACGHTSGSAGEPAADL